MVGVVAGPAVMSIHRLSAGAGYQYLLRHTATGDVGRLAGSPLTAYYTASGYPPGRWLGGGLAGLGVTAGGDLQARQVEPPARTQPSAREDEGAAGDLAGVAAGGVASVLASVSGGMASGSVVSEEQMGRLFGRGEDPLTGDRLGARYVVHRSTEARVADRVARLADDLPEADRAAAVAGIEAAERRRGTPSAVAGFDLTFTMPKSASVLWALAAPGLQARIARAHRDTVAEVVAVLERDALFTRTGHGGVAQIGTRGAIATCFDHWDTRSGDPNLHTHVVLANRVQGPDGVWRSVDSRALHHAAVAFSELYDTLLADRLAQVAGVSWGWRSRGSRRTPAFEIDGVDDTLLAEFSTRSVHIETRTRALVTAFRDRTGRAPDRAEVLRLRQQATLQTRPEKTLRPLAELIAGWRRRAEALTSREALVGCAAGGRPRLLAADEVSDEQLTVLAGVTLAGLQDRRSTWNEWNLRAEAARATRGLRMASTGDRLALLDQVTGRVLDRHCVRLDPPALFRVPAQWQRPDGASAFTRQRETSYTSPAILHAETRLLAAATDTAGPRAGTAAAEQAAQAVHADQAAAVVAVATSGRRLDVLVGPAGAGKTRTLRAVRAAWEAEHGPASVIGLAPSATAAAELTAAVGIACETTAKWQHETTAPTSGPTTSDRNADRYGAERHDRWRLRPGQLVIVDEASLAGTLTLDQLAAQAGAAGAKVLLVGDHHQLSAVNAGGAFGLLARDTGAAELSLLWRFTHRWEAHASRALRQGDRRALDTYTAHGRLAEGPAEAILEEAYRAWQQALAGGTRAVLIAADNSTVAALNARAQTDRIATGQVTIPATIPGGTAPGGVVALHDGSHAAVGDRVLTRRNDRRLQTSRGSWVRNGDLWTVARIHPDGSLTVRRPKAAGAAGGAALADSSTDSRLDAARLPAAYVGEHVELGYATTVHRAQGITADTAFVLVRPGMSREALYVALTRGRTANYAYVATDLPDPDHADQQYPSGPDMGPRTGRQVLDGVLARSDAEPSATETLRDRFDAATSLATLVPVHETLVQAAARTRWTRVLERAVVDAAALERITDSPAFGALVAALASGERDGHDMTATLTHAATTLSDPGTADGSDPATLLHGRITHWLEQNEPVQEGRLIGGLVPAAGAVGDTELAGTLREIEHLMGTRIRALVTTVVRKPPDWALPLGPPPRDPTDRRAWLDAVGIVAGYRDLHQIQDNSLLGARDEQQLADGAARRRATAAAAAAARLAGRRTGAAHLAAAPPATDRSLQR